MLVSDFDFELPQNLIAHKPLSAREQAKMLVFNGDKNILNRKIIDLVDFLQEGDVLVFNDVRVINAKLQARIGDSDCVFDFNLDQEIAPKLWRCIGRKVAKIKDGERLKIADDFFAVFEKNLGDGFFELYFLDDDYLLKIEKYGSVPIPPYIKREKNLAHNDKNDYQTIYAKAGKAVAAPTAGLHFNEKIFSLLEKKGIKKVFVTLNVGAGTFLPVRSQTLEEHKMHEEFFEISAQTAKIINEAKALGHRIIAVGTTSLRALESVADNCSVLQEIQCNTKIFIYPPYRFKVVDVLVTNFHLPKSTLFMLICAFVGKENAHKIYEYAIENEYRFYSYGDACLLVRGL